MPRNGNFFARIEAQDAQRPNRRPAFETADGAVLTYAELIDEVARAAAALKSLGVKPGDRVMAQVEKSLANVFLYLATLKVGAVFNPLNSAYTAAELEYFIADAEPTVIVAAAERIAEIEPAAAKAQGARAADHGRRRQRARSASWRPSSKPLAPHGRARAPTISPRSSTPPAPPGAPRAP